MPVAPLDAPGCQRILAPTHHLAIEGTVRTASFRSPSAPRHSPDTGRTWQARTTATTDRIESWSRSHLTRLVELDASGAATAAGDTLLQLDLRTDNVLFIPSGPDHDVVVDRPGATVGTAWVDVVTLLPALHPDGRPPPDHVLEQHPHGRAADSDAVTAFLASFAGFFTRRGLLDLPPGLPTLRSFQDARGRVARRWLARRLDGERST